MALTGCLKLPSTQCALAEAYDVKVVPHGHHILAAAHVVAAQPPSVCPMVEYLFHSHLDRMQYFHKRILRPEKGSLTLPLGPGLGFVLDEEKIGDKRELRGLSHDVCDLGQ